jgi:hypothetical protein
MLGQGVYDAVPRLKFGISFSFIRLKNDYFT